MATSPPEKPLLYRFIPSSGSPAWSTTEEWISPASIPKGQPNTPAKGARVVPNRPASCKPLLFSSTWLSRLPASTPAMTGTMLKACLP